MLAMNPIKCLPTSTSISKPCDGQKPLKVIL